MDFIEKAKILITNWVDHNELHQEEYESFAKQLEEAGKKESALHIREMATLTGKSNESLRNALESLGKD